MPLFAASIYRVYCVVSHHVAKSVPYCPTLKLRQNGNRFSLCGAENTMKKPEKRKNEFKLRIYDEDTLINLDELLKTGHFDSMNGLLNKVIEKGAATMLASYGKHRALSDDDIPYGTSMLEITKKLTSMTGTLDDIFVLMSIVETLCAIQFNIEVAKITGEPVTEELLQSGAFSDLPEWLQDVKDTIIRSNLRRK